jgi:phenylacetate-CoA ligase
MLEAAQWWDPERIQRERDRLLRSLIATAYHDVPFYRFLMDREGVRVDAIRGVQDLHRLPVVTKDEIRRALYGRTIRATGQPTYATSTSGSTGSTFVVPEDAYTFGWYLSTAILTWEWAGWEIGRPHLQTGINPTRNFKRRLKDRLLRCHYVSAYDLTDSALTSHLRVLERSRIEFLFGYPGSLYLLARHAARQGWNRPMAGIITWGDNLYRHYRDTIETTFGTQVLDTYGMSEGIQIAAQCRGNGPYHVLSLDVAVEILDDRGKPVAPEDVGNIVVTRLHPGPMPFIRYRTGDVGVRGEAIVCGCGRGFEAMKRIQGRETDIVLTPSGNRLIVHFFTGILERFPEIESFQVVQNELESVVIRVVPGTDYTPAISRRMVEELRNHGAADLNISVEEVTTIPVPPSLKRRFVVSNMGTGKHATHR